MDTGCQLRKCLLAAFFVACAPAFAQAPGILVDPMRPADVREAPSASARSAAPAPAGPGVQVILNSPERKLALIDGKLVAIGGEARGGTLVGLSDSSAVVSKGDARDVLLMHPNIEKKPASRSAP